MGALFETTKSIYYQTVELAKYLQAKGDGKK